MSDLRPSPIAGTWYPGDAEALARSVDLQLAEAELEPAPGPVVGLVAPHAGHRYSGGVAAHAFRAVAGMSPEVVAVVSPMHQPHPAAVLSTAHAAYWTPLGMIEVDQGLLTAFEAALRRTTELAVVRVARDTEHSLEIELPFLQRSLAGPFRLLPIMLRDQSAAVAQAVGRALAEVLRGRSALVVGSSDLSHFYPAATARRLDGEMLARLAAFDPQALLQAEDEGVGFLLVLANAFFVAAEFALVSVRRTRIRELSSQGHRAAAWAERAVANPDRFIAATQLGITLASLGLGWVGEPALSNLLLPVVSLFPGANQAELSHTLSAGLAFALITFLHVVVGELAPKSIALQDPERTALLERDQGE